MRDNLTNSLGRLLDNVNLPINSALDRLYDDRLYDESRKAKVDFFDMRLDPQPMADRHEDDLFSQGGAEFPKTNNSRIPFSLEDTPTRRYSPVITDSSEVEFMVTGGIKGSGRGGGNVGGRGYGRGRLDSGNGNGGGNDGGHTETTGNNLSFPAIWYNGAGDDPLGLDSEYEDSLSLTAPFSDDPDNNGYYYFAQKTEGNKWQAGNMEATGTVEVDYVDIGDALESAPVRLERFLRIELALYDDLSTDGDYTPDSMRAYHMTQLSEQTGRNEVQGTRATSNRMVIENDSNRIDALLGTTYDSSFATVYAPTMGLTIQRLEGDDLTGASWDGSESKWVGTGIGEIDYAANTQFGTELNVAGKVINGVSDRPFRFTDPGLYRITFSLPNELDIVLTADTQVANYSAEGFSELTEGRTTTIVEDGALGVDGNDTHNGLLYMDILVPTVMGGGEEEVLPVADDTFV